MNYISRSFAFDVTATLMAARELVAAKDIRGI